MKHKVIAKFDPDTVKFELPVSAKQDTLNEALRSARKCAVEAFGLHWPLSTPDALKVTVERCRDIE